jgi:voltage-gated potassium channel
MKKPRLSLRDQVDTLPELLGWYSLVLLLSAWAFSALEHRNAVDSLWWAAETAMTLGNGDVVAVTPLGRLLSAALSHVVPLFFGPMIAARIIVALMADRNAWTHEEQEEVKRRLGAILVRTEELEETGEAHVFHAARDR